MKSYLRKFWGWGDLHQSWNLREAPKFYEALEERFGALHTDQKLPKEDEIELPAGRLTSEDLQSLGAIVGEKNIYHDHATRLYHSLGKSTVDLIQAKALKRLEAPDCVLFPKTEAEILKILQFCASSCESSKISVVPFGGGSSVLGGVHPRKNENHRALLTLNLQCLNQVLEMNPRTHTARIQAGILGPDLEKKLNEKKYTLGHFPQSFEFSTLGGWIATRGSGQFSTFYGNISDQVVSVRMVTSQGIVETRKVPASSTGPSFKEMLVGSEGIFGVITEAVMQIHPLPQKTQYQSYLFPSFEAGIEALRQIKENDLDPLIARLSDPLETHLFLKMKKSETSFFQKKIFSLLLKFKKIEPSKMCYLLVGFQGTSESVRAQMRSVQKICPKALCLGQKPAQNWFHSRFQLPYLRDALLDSKILTDTFETATSWDTVFSLYQHVLVETQKKIGSNGMVFCHVSHIYLTGACLYFTFLTKFKEDPLKQMKEIKHHVTETILKQGGTLSHHHGIGIDHRDFLKEEHGPEFVKVLKNMKQSLDPESILNPQKVIQ